MSSENVSDDLIWSLTNGHHAKLCKRRDVGGVFFSRDPLNLTNKHSRKYEGFTNSKAIGIQPTHSGKGIAMTLKNPSKINTPGKAVSTTTFSSAAPRATYRGIVSSTAKRGYRADVRAEAVARASAILQSQRKKKDMPEKKPRGARARKAAAAKESKS